MARPIRVLLVDDDGDDRLIVRTLLDRIAHQSYEVQEAESPTDAQAALAGLFEAEADSLEPAGIDICLVDYRLGGDTGLDLVQWVAGHCPRLPVVMLTGQGNHDTDLAAMAAGAMDYLPKDELGPALLERAIRYAIARKQTEAELRRQAIRDALTGLYNRRHLFATMESELARAVRFGGPLAVMLLDCDRFKDINDRFGHLVGDEVLCAVAATIQATARRVDMAARYGGEEFALLLPGTDLTGAARMGARLRAQIAEKPVPVDGGPVPVTVSIGVAAIGPDLVTADALLNAADQALYRAKHRGRNQVAQAGDESADERVAL